MIVVGGIVKRTTDGPEWVDTMPFLWWIRGRQAVLGRVHDDEGVTDHLMGELQVHEDPSTFMRRLRRWRHEQQLLPLKTVEDMLTGTSVLLADIYPIAANEIETWEPPAPRCCAQCGVSIERLNRNCSYCSRTCRLLAHPPVRVEFAPCEWCGGEILGRGPAARFCGDRCRVRARNKRERDARPRVTTCKWCGGDLDLTRPTSTRFCSREHRKAATAARRLAAKGRP